MIYIQQEHDTILALLADVCGMTHDFRLPQRSQSLIEMFGQCDIFNE
jgi:hypothetical protein